MGLYRTKPDEVEAIQYTGSLTAPFKEAVPQWVWGALAAGNLVFSNHGIEVRYNGLSEMAMPNDWLILPADGIIRVSDDKTFAQYYSPARKRSDELTPRKSRAKADTPKAVEPQEEAAVAVVSDTDDFDAAFDAIASKVGQVGAAE